MGSVEQLRHQSHLESELVLQQNLVKTLQNNIEALKAEVKRSREDVVSAEKVVDYLTTQVADQERIQDQEELLLQLENQLRDEQIRSNTLEFEKNKIIKRANEIDRQNTMLIAQFSEQFMPYYVDEEVTEDDLREKFNDIQQIIQSNIQLQQKVEDMESNSNNDLPVPGGDQMKYEFEQTKAELNKTKLNFDHANTQIKRLQTFVDYYKMKYEESGPDESTAEEMDTGDAPQFSRSKSDHGELSKLRTELSSAFSRLDELNSEKQNRERAYEELVSQKNELVSELLASKGTLELKVQSQEATLEEMQKRLNDLDKTNRTLDGQRIKTTTEHEAMKSNLESLQVRFNQIESENRELSSNNRDLRSDLESANCELAELRVKCESLADNEAVSTSITSTLDEFREAYMKLDSAQLTQAKEQLETLRKDNETLANFVKAMNVQQMFAMDKMKTTLSDAQLQREAYSQECTVLKQKLNTIQLEHDELIEKHDILAQQLVDIDTSDATLESCRKQIQQLRNKISYLEKTVAETNARAEKWNVQLAVSEKQCKTFKEIAETLEKNLQENEEKFLRERNRLQELCDTANVQHREGQTTIENLRAEISEMQGQFSSREAELEHKINEWKAQVAEMEKERLELGAQLDNLEGELTVVRNREEELRSELSQKQIEIGDLTELKNALDDAVNDKTNEIEECRTEIQTLTDNLASSDSIVAEVRQGLQSEIDSLQQKLAIFEKAHLDDQGNRQSVLDSVSEMLSRIATEADQLPLNISTSGLETSAEMGKALEIIERMQREKTEETNRRLQLIAEQQSSIATPAEDMVPMQEFNAAVTKLRGQIEAQSAEIQEKMEQISELKLLEGTRERCDLLEAELSAARNELERTKKALAEQQISVNQSTFKAQKFETMVKELNVKYEKVRELAKHYKAQAEKIHTMQQQQSSEHTSEQPETSSEQASEQSSEHPPLKRKREDE